MGLPTTESSYVVHATKSIQGFKHPDFPVLRVAIEVLNATEGYLWVSHLLFYRVHTLHCRSSVIYADQGWHIVPV